MKRWILFFLFTVLLTACNAQQENRYFTGSEGVDATFTPNGPPNEIFVEQGKSTEFAVEVRVQNKGASVTKGGVYLSGYDPTVLDIQEIDEERSAFRDCRMNIHAIGKGTFDGVVQCRELDLGPLGSVDLGISFEDGIEISLSELNIGGILDNLFSTDAFSQAGLDRTNIRFDSTGGGQFSIGFDNPTFNADRAARGPYFLSLWAPWSFELNEGREYTLKGDTPANPGINEEYISFTAEATLPEDAESTTQPIQATNCYLYTTHASTQVCIDPDPYGEQEEVCTPTPYTSRGGQGAPLAITDVSQQQSGEKVAFDITVEHIGDGTVYNPLRINKCSPYHPEPATERDVNTVVLGMVYVGDKMLECTPDEHTMELYNGKGQVTCVMNVDDATVSSSGYETPLMVELWYGYSETVRTNVKIRRI